MGKADGTSCYRTGNGRYEVVNGAVSCATAHWPVGNGDPRGCRVCRGSVACTRALLREAASAWIVSDPVTASDVAVVGEIGPEMGSAVAAELYKKGLVTKVLVPQFREMPNALIGVLPSYTELKRLWPGIFEATYL
jgi:hypothetical protein